MKNLCSNEKGSHACPANYSTPVTIGKAVPNKELSGAKYELQPNKELSGAKSELQGETMGVCSSYMEIGQPLYNSALRGMQMCLLVYIKKRSPYE